MISERNLKRWRKEALINSPGNLTSIDRLTAISQLNDRILRMTQELLDLHLIRK